MADKTLPPINMYDPDAMKALPLNEQYAHFCALGFSDDYEIRYKAGLVDFLELIEIDNIEIGFAWEGPCLVIGTDRVCVTDGNGEERVLGHYALVMSHSGYIVVNTTSPLGEYAHPHAMQKSGFCMANGNLTIKARIKDGRYAGPVKKLLTALYMKDGTVTTGFPYANAALSQWPRKDET